MTETSKTGRGRFFEDFALGETLRHATPRTVTDGDRALYLALYGARFSLTSADTTARLCGLPESPLDELAAFHIGFGKTVPDVSVNAVANLGYAECRFHRPVFVGDTLSTSSQVIGLKQNSNGLSGVVWVRSRAVNQLDEPVADWARWVMVTKRDQAAPAPETKIPDLAESVSADDLILPEELDFSRYDVETGGQPHLWEDYSVGERIAHGDGVTLEEAEHMMATRLWQNTAKVHFNAQSREDGRRLIYGGHVISHARALSFDGLANAQPICAINAGAHANPAFAGDTLYAWSQVLDKAETRNRSVGALRLRLVAVKNAPATDFRLKDAEGRYLPDVLLDLDYWAFMPRAMG